MRRYWPTGSPREEATYVRKLKKSDGQIDWSLPAEQIRNRVRGFNPWPSCFCEAPRGSGARLKILSARVEEGHGTPGEVLNVAGDGPLVATGENALRLVDVQPEGKKNMPGSAYLRGHRLQIGEHFG